jgi:hypothetical protein
MIEKLLHELGIQITDQNPLEQKTETPIEAMMNDMRDQGMMTEELVKFMTPYTELERIHLCLAFDEGSLAASMLGECEPPKDSSDYFRRTYM